MFTFNHNSINVFHLEKSLDFYAKALDLKEVNRFSPPDGRFTIVFLADGTSKHRLELTWLAGRPEPYQLGDNEFHLCLTTDDFPGAHQRHAKMGCICYENPEMGLYFINDPDGYWIEIIPADRLPKANQEN
jgi:lactoylglutathione lyase